MTPTVARNAPLMGGLYRLSACDALKAQRAGNEFLHTHFLVFAALLGFPYYASLFFSFLIIYGPIILLDKDIG